MKKFKFNRFNIIIISTVFIVLLFFVVSLFRTYSDIVDKDPSKVEGDTVYVNDQASDYYYWLGMNYVGDLNSYSTNYTDSSLKKVTINYYGYPSNNTSLTGYVSLNTNERQNKFVYYKYFPIKNNQITFELIDNPFSDRPKNKAFGGWTSSDGTITTNSNTNVQTITVSSSVNTVNIYANWVDANVHNIDNRMGVVSACYGDTLLPCVFDSINYRQHYCYISSKKIVNIKDVTDYKGLYSYKKEDGLLFIS